MFNADQMAHMRNLNAMPLEARCWCGWWVKGDCIQCQQNGLGDLTTADRVKAMCPDCKSEPSRPGAPIRHRIGCRSSLQTHVKE